MQELNAMPISRPITVCAVLLTAAPLFGADILVPQDAATIQGAIDAAASGDRVLVSPGTWTGPINFLGKSIVLESSDGAAATVIDGQGEVGHVVTIASGESAGTVIRGFTITGGFGEPGSMGAGPGGGVLIENASVLIEACTLIGNTGILGGAVSILKGGEAIIRGTRFEANTGFHGGGLYVEQGKVTIEESEFHGNTSTSFGGALAIFWLSESTISDTSFTGNKSGSFGAAIYTNHATIDFQRLLIADNGETEALEDGVSFIVSPFGGGGIYTTSTNGRVQSSRILRNSAVNGTGLYIAESGTIEVVNTLIADNGALCGCGLGAIYASSSNPVITNSTVVGNGGFFGVYTTYNAFPTVTNSIFAGQVNNLDSQNPFGGNGSTTATYSLLQGTIISNDPESGNIITPGFPLLDAANDYAPLAGSAAIDAGNNTALPADIVTDLLGNDRFFDDPDTEDGGLGNGAIVDIGAIEFGAAGGGTELAIVGDMDSDGVVGMNDLLMLLGSWGACSGCAADMNDDGAVDMLDMLALISHWGTTG